MLGETLGRTLSAHPGCRESTRHRKTPSASPLGTFPALRSKQNRHRQEPGGTKREKPPKALSKQLPTLLLLLERHHSR